MDHSPEQLKAFIGKPALDLPTPSLVLRHDIIQTNCSRLLSTVKELGIGFRAHVKTLKVSKLALRADEQSSQFQSIEVTRLMLGSAHHKVIASTLREIRGLLPLVDEGIVEEVNYYLQYCHVTLLITM